MQTALPRPLDSAICMQIAPWPGASCPSLNYNDAWQAHLDLALADQPGSYVSAVSASAARISSWRRARYSGTAFIAGRSLSWMSFSSRKKRSPS